VEEWYTKQSFFEEGRLDRIKHWMQQNVVDIFSYSVDSVNSQLA
jgi:hypothetical protein